MEFSRIHFSNLVDTETGVMASGVLDISTSSQHHKNEDMLDFRVVKIENKANMTQTQGKQILSMFL